MKELVGDKPRALPTQLVHGTDVIHTHTKSIAYPKTLPTSKDNNVILHTEKCHR